MWRVSFDLETTSVTAGWSVFLPEGGTLQRITGCSPTVYSVASLLRAVTSVTIIAVPDSTTGLVLDTSSSPVSQPERATDATGARV